MLKFQTATKEELKLAAAVQRRRQIEAERKERIFNARFRKIGIDKEFLDKQVEEKKQQRELEEARESELDEILLQSCKIGLVRPSAWLFFSSFLKLHCFICDWYFRKGERSTKRSSITDSNINNARNAICRKKAIAIYPSASCNYCHDWFHFVHR